MKKILICLLVSSFVSAQVLAYKLPNELRVFSKRPASTEKISALNNRMIDTLTKKWFFTTGAEFETALIGQEKFYITLEDVLICINTKSGTEEWSHFGSYSLVDFATNETLFFVIENEDTDPSLLAMDDNGKTRWRVKLDKNSFSGVTLSNDRQTLYLNSGENLLALDLNGKTKWIYPEKKSKILAFDDNNVYVLKEVWGLNRENEFTIKAIDGKNGTLKWSNILDKDIAILSKNILIKDNVLYLTARTLNDNSRIYAISSDGKVKWIYDIKNYCISNILSINDHGIYVLSQDLHRSKLFLLSFNKEEKWNFDKFDPINSIDIESSGTVYFTTHGTVYAINNAGNIEWFYKSPNSPWIVGIFDGALYGFGYDSNDDDVILSYNLQTGSEQIKYKSNSEIYWMAIREDTLYFANVNGVGSLSR